MKYTVNKVNCVLKKSDIRKLTDLNNTVYTTAEDASELVGANNLPKSKKGALVIETVRSEVEET